MEQLLGHCDTQCHVIRGDCTGTQLEASLWIQY